VTVWGKALISLGRSRWEKEKTRPKPVVDDLQLLLSLPLTTFTYHAVLAKAAGTANNNVSTTTHMSLILDFTALLLIWRSRE
jgi:hypothetical protein